MIKIKCDYIGGAVAVPTEVIDKHLKLAPSASFKVLLFILRNPDATENAEQISASTGLGVNDVRDCLDYWESYGVILDDKKPVDKSKKIQAAANAKSLKQDEIKNEEEAPKKEEKKLQIKSLPVKKPTQREIALRLSEEPLLQEVYREAQNILGTFGYDTQGLILMIYDYYGFPPEVILTLLQHQKEIGKTSSAAIKGRAEDWAKRGIDNIEEVEKELLIIEKVDRLYEDIKDSCNLSSPSPRIMKYLREWTEHFKSSKELILYALEESENTFSDANKLLKKWANQGVKTPGEAQEKQKKSLPKEVKKSYDTDKVGKNSVLDWMKKYSD